MTFTDPADGGIARHLADGPEIVGEQERARTRPSRRRGGLAPSVASPDNNDIPALGHSSFSFLSS